MNHLRLVSIIKAAIMWVTVHVDLVIHIFSETEKKQAKTALDFLLLGLNPVFFVPLATTFTALQIV